MKIVIDTNTLINASADDYNYGNRIIDSVIDGRVEAFANRQTIKENRFLVSQKITDPAYLDKLNKYFDVVQFVETEYLDVVEDKEDNKILASAVSAAVDYLVTSDWHLLKLESYEGIKIVTPQGFWAEYESETGEGWQNWLNNFIN